MNAVRLPENHEGVSATANEVSEEEKLRKLCGYSVNAVRLPENHEGVSATVNAVSEEEKLLMDG